MFFFRGGDKDSYELQQQPSPEPRQRLLSDDPEDTSTTTYNQSPPSPSWLPEWLSPSRQHRYARVGASPAAARRTRRRIIRRSLSCCLTSTMYIFIILIVVATVFFPSYTHLPPHYRDLRNRALASDKPGRANVWNEKIFIATTMYDPDGKLLGGQWAENVFALIDLIGPENVYLSLYENDPDPGAAEAMVSFEKRLKCMSNLAIRAVSPLFFFFLFLIDLTLHSAC